MIDHAAVNVTDLDAAKAFYERRSRRSATRSPSSPARASASATRTGWISASSVAILSAVPTWRLQL